MKMKKLSFASLIAVIFSLVAVFAALAQSDELDISFSREFGYSSGGGDIQGLFSIKVSGPDSLTKVAFYVDDTMIGEDVEAPFKLQFNTDNYSLGEHAVYAIGTTSGGNELKTEVVHANFVSASEGTKTAVWILIPVLGLVVVALILAAVVPIITGRKTIPLEPGTPRNYPMGGAICPKCERPFAIHLYGVNLGLGKFDRCPYCGKWSVVRRQPLQALRAAEEAELERAQEIGSVQGMTKEEKLKKQLEDSKFQ